MPASSVGRQTERESYKHDTLTFILRRRLLICILFRFSKKYKQLTTIDPKMFRSAVRGTQMLLRRLSSKSDHRIVPPATKRKNVFLALTLCGFVGGIYYT